MWMIHVCARSCLTLCSSMDCSWPGSFVHGISQARILAWVAISFSRGSSRPRDQTCVSCISCVAGGSLPRQRLGSPWIIYLLLFSGSVMFDCLRPHGLSPTRLLCPWDFPSKNTGVGCHVLLQETFPTQGLNPGLLH